MGHIDDVVAEVSAAGLPTTTVDVVTSPADGVEIERLTKALQSAAEADEMSNAPNEAPKVARQLADVEAKAKTTEFTVRALGAKAWSDLEAKHPPTDAQRQLGYRVNPDTFDVAAVAACTIEPQGATVESIGRLYESIATSEWGKLVGVVRGLNLAGQSPLSQRLGKPYEALLATGPKLS